MATTQSGTRGPRKAAARRGDRPSFQPPPFGRSLAMLLLLAREAVMQRWRPFLHARGLTDQQWRVIRALVEFESLEIIELGARCCIHPASLSRIVPKLAADGIVSRRANAADQRRVVVSLTPRGRRLYESVMPAAERVYAEFARDIGPERLARIYELLQELPVLLGEPKPTERAPDARVGKPRPSKRKGAVAPAPRVTA